MWQVALVQRNMYRMMYVLVHVLLAISYYLIHSVFPNVMAIIYVHHLIVEMGKLRYVVLIKVNVV